MYYMFGFYGTSCFIWKSGTPLQPIFSIIQPLNVNFNFHRLSTVSVADCLLWNVSADVAISTFTDTLISITLSVVHRSLWYYLKNRPFLYFCFVIFFEEIILNLKNKVFHQKRLTNTLAISPRWLSDDHLQPRYGQKRVVSFKWPNILITAPLHQIMKKRKINFFVGNVLPIRS